MCVSIRVFVTKNVRFSVPPIVRFSIPSCAFLRHPQVTGTLGHQEHRDTRSLELWDTGKLGHLDTGIVGTRTPG